VEVLASRTLGGLKCLHWVARHCVMWSRPHLYRPHVLYGLEGAENGLDSAEGRTPTIVSEKQFVDRVGDGPRVRTTPESLPAASSPKWRWLREKMALDLANRRSYHVQAQGMAENNDVSSFHGHGIPILHITPRIMVFELSQPLHRF
jgi:hypothetical protein